MIIFLAQINGNIATLDGEESWHCAKVLRKKPGEKIRLIDGKGHFYDAELSLVTEKKCEAKIVKGPEFQQKRPYYLHLAIAPTKQIDRLEWMLEKAVEIGIDEISILICHNSERTVVKTDRLEKIILSAVKQSLQAYIPKLQEPENFRKFIESAGADQKFIAHCEEGDKTDLKSVQFRGKKTLVLIGPEGDFSPEEIKLAVDKGYGSISLGESRLRTETAGLFVVNAAHLLS